MDFLKSAVASAISKGPAFGYSFGDRVDIDHGIWALYNSTKRDDGSQCSIFSFDVNANRNRLPLARNALRKLRTLRHPGVVKVLDTLETDSYIYIATERLTPLTWHLKRKSVSEETIKWGLHNIARTVKFINTDATSVHACIRASSIFFGESGEWKLAGFDALSSMKEDDAVLFTCGSLILDASRYMAPEVANGGWEVVRKNPVHAVDAYDFGILIFEVFNGSFNGSEQLTQLKSIPPSMHQSYKKLLNPNPKSRMSVGDFMAQGTRLGGFFKTPLIQVTEDIENIGLKGEAEMEELLSKLDEVADDFPADFFKMKVLPELLKSVEFGGGGARVFGTVMQIGVKLSDEEFEALITPVVIRLFSNPDRAIRVCLLDNLPKMIDRFSNKIVNDKIFPQMVTGFTDAAPLVRENTVKAVLVVVPKLSERIVNGELLRYLAKTANDDQPGIRTNTTICLGKIARNLGANNRAKVLSAAFSRALRDPFVHARNAALLALAATVDLYSEEDCATKLLPVICPALVDKETLVRDQAQKTMDIYLGRIRKYTQTMPDSVLPSPSLAPGTNAPAPRMSSPAPDSSWTGWAISSFTNKLSTASGDIRPTSSGGPSTQRPSSVPPPVPTTSKPVTLHPKTGMTLNKSATSVASSITSPDPAAAFNDDAEDFGDDWGAFGEEDSGSKSKSNKAFDPFESIASGTSTTGTTKTTAFDDKGEPDFAGWLAAQSNTKKVAKTPLLKGLNKSSTSSISKSSRPAIGERSKTIGAATAAKKVAVAPKKKEVPKVSKTKPNEDEEEGWGDDW